MEIKELCSKFFQNFNVGLENTIDADPQDFLAKDPGRFIVSEGNVVSLKATCTGQSAAIRVGVRSDPGNALCRWVLGCLGRGRQPAIHGIAQ